MLYNELNICITFEKQTTISFGTAQMCFLRHEHKGPERNIDAAVPTSLQHLQIFFLTSVPRRRRVCLYPVLFAWNTSWFKRKVRHCFLISPHYSVSCVRHMCRHSAIPIFMTLFILSGDLNFDATTTSTAWRVIWFLPLSWRAQTFFAQTVFDCCNSHNFSEARLWYDRDALCLNSTSALLFSLRLTQFFFSDYRPAFETVHCSGTGYRAVNSLYDLCVTELLRTSATSTIPCWLARWKPFELLLHWSHSAPNTWSYSLYAAVPSFNRLSGGLIPCTQTACHTGLQKLPPFWPRQ